MKYYIAKLPKLRLHVLLRDRDPKNHPEEEIDRPIPVYVCEDISGDSELHDLFYHLLMSVHEQTFVDQFETDDIDQAELLFQTYK